MIPTETWVLPRPRADKYVGSFPLHFEQKLHRLLGEPEKVLHPFGGLCEIGDSVDLNETTTPTWVGDAHDLHWIADGTYDLVVLDPPYSDEEAAWLYSTPPLKWGVFVAEAVRVTRVGGHVAVYHVKQPPRPAGTKLVQRVVVLTRTWHAPRVCFIFEKLPSAGLEVGKDGVPEREEIVRQAVLGHVPLVQDGQQPLLGGVAGAERGAAAVESEQFGERRDVSAEALGVVPGDLDHVAAGADADGVEAAGHGRESTARDLRCAVCGEPYGSRAHREGCSAGVSSEACVCPPGLHLPDCVEVAA